MYNMTNISSGLSGVINFSNTVTGGAMGWLTSFAIFIVAFVSLSTAYSPREALATSSFLTLLIIVPFWVIGFVPDLMLLAFGVLSATSLAFLVIGSRI